LVDVTRFGVSRESMAVDQQEIISSNEPFSIYLYLLLMSSVLAKAVAVKSQMTANKRP